MKGVLKPIAIVYVILSVIFIAGFSINSNAQVDTGSITGTVTDASGLVIAGAKVTAKSTATGVERSAETGKTGEYTLQGLPPGMYRVRASNASFKTFEATVEVTVGGKVTLSPRLEVGSSTVTVEVTAGTAEVNTQSQELAQLVDSTQLAQLPTLNRNPYDFVVLSGNISNGDNTTSDMNSAQNMAARGVGFAINGQREAGTEILLDGVENVAVFGVNVGQLVPQDSVQEYSVLTNNYGAEYGRASGGVVNVDTRAGTNAVHGSAFEYNRLSRYTANTFANAINNVPKGKYTRNDFGFNAGAPIIKNKLFASYSHEFVRVRSNANVSEDVFDPALIALMPSNIQQYFSTYGTGALPASTTYTAGALQAAGFFGSAGGVNNPVPLVNGMTAIPATTPVLDTVTFHAPFDSGGGVPQNTYNLLGRIDFNLNNATQMFFRLARFRENDFQGADGYTPYPQYDVGGYSYDDSYLYSVNHSFSPNVLSNTKLSFTRFNVANNFNTALTHTPNLYLNTTTSQSTNPISGNIIQLPGLQNSTTGSGGLPFGGPQDTIQIGEDLAWTKGRHTMRFGGDLTYIQLNVAYGAYFQAVEALGNLTPVALNSLFNAGGLQQNGVFASPVLQFSARVDAQGALPCQTDVAGGLIVTPACTVTPPLPAASIARSYRYWDWDFFAMDSFRVTRKLTINYGMRYEHYGVQHNNNQSLDSNFYQSAGSGPEAWAVGVRNGGVFLTQKSPAGQFWENRWGTPAPRIGFAYDVFGDGKTALRGGFGLSYERNFGNVTYNASFNPPASAVVNTNCAPNANGVIATCPYFVTSLPLGPLGQAGPPAGLPPSELRDNDFKINVAQTQFWSASLEHQFFPRSLLAISYSGAHSVHLYDLANVNLIGAGNFYLGDPLVTGSFTNAAGVTEPCPFSNPVTGVATCYTRLNSQYTNINKRGSMGQGSYSGLNVKFQAQDILRSGVTLLANYTWSHSLDDLSSTFSESLSNASLGYTNYTNPQLDYASSDYDVRHRFVVSPIWQTPWFKNGKGFLTQALGGWYLSGIFTVRTGIPFSLYDVTDLLNFYDIPRLTPASPITQFHVSSSPMQTSATSNTFVGLTAPAAASIGALDPALGISDFGPYPKNMTGRNIFTGPGAWNTDLAVQKNFKLTERFGLQFRAEGFDVFNHHNYYIFNGANFTAQGAGPVQAIEEKGGLGNAALGGNHDERRFGQFSLRVTF